MERIPPVDERQLVLYGASSRILLPHQDENERQDLIIESQGCKTMRKHPPIVCLANLMHQLSAPQSIDLPVMIARIYPDLMSGGLLLE
jgi:hypothetical protein